MNVGSPHFLVQGIVGRMAVTEDALCMANSCVNDH